MAEVPMPDIKPNSNAYKSGEVKEKRKLAPVVTSDKLAKKKSGKIFGFIDRDDLSDMIDDFFFDVLIPEVKDGFLDMVSVIIRADGYRGRSGKRRDRDRKSYDKMYRSSSYRGRDDRDSDRRERRRDDRDRDREDYSDIVLTYRKDAEKIVDKLHELIEETGEASIADLYQLVDITSKYTDENWGWTRTGDIGIRKVSGGFLIDVSEPRYLA